MSNTFKCPFCHKEMITVVPNMVYNCTQHSLLVKPQERSATFSPRAPKYLLDSQTVLEKFHDLNPAFVMSSHKLFSESFNIADCKFVGPNLKDDVVPCADISRLNVKLDIVDKFLIAGNGMIADIVKDYFRFSLHFGSENNPIVFEATPTADKWLWLKVLLESTDIRVSSKIDVATDAYFAPTLEHKIALLSPVFNVNLRPLTDEEILYSCMLTQPHINIRWAKSADALIENIKSFIKACVKDIENIQVETLEGADAMPTSMNLGPNWGDEYRRAFFGGQPSTAINQEGSNGFVSFDILNHEFAYNYFEGYDAQHLTGMQLIALYQTWVVYSALYDKYCKNEQLLGYNKKLDYLISHNTFDDEIFKLSPNMVVVRFWQVLQDYINNSL